ncbi:hypothetical protein D3C86_1737290 [compost metagenome]
MKREKFDAGIWLYRFLEEMWNVLLAHHRCMLQQLVHPSLCKNTVIHDKRLILIRRGGAEHVRDTDRQEEEVPF